jgi:Tol biopolymer transport system component
MNAIAKSSVLKILRRGARVLTVVWLCFVVHHCSAAPSFVYETPYEFLTSGDFNGDGVLDVLVLDKITGNARVGYGDTNGNLTWSAPLVTGVGEATGCAVGPLLQTNRDAVAVTAPTVNSVNIVDLSGTNAAGTPMVVTPLGLGPHTVVPLADPLGGVSPTYNDLLIASSDNSGSAELLDLMSINAGVGAETGQFGESGPFDRGNALQLSVTPATFAAGIVRGSNDTLDVWQFTNAPAVMLSYSNLPAGSDYAFGNFNGETLPRFLFYLPGSSNVTVVNLRQPSSRFVFGAPMVISLSEAVQGVFYESFGTNGSALILFSNGIQALSLPGGSPVLSSVYGSGAGAAGNVFTGVVPLGNNMLTLLDAPPGGTSSIHAQVVRFDGANYTQLSSSNLPTTTARNTRANVWLFQSEPFVNRQAGFIASFNTPDWSDSVSGLPGALNVTVQDDGGAATGLGTVATNTLGAPPAGSAYGLPNQYNPAISVFSYASPQPAESVTVTISPPPGIYDGPIQISFSTLNALDKVFYRVGAGDSWHTYSSSFPLTNDNTIQFYGANASDPTRSQLQSAVYSLGVNGQPTPTVNLANGTSTTNPPPAFVPPPNVILSPVGTIFYGRRSVADTGTIWAINYDGSDDTYVTTGVRPRVSRDGNWMAFMRGDNEFSSQGSLWLRNLQTGQEEFLFRNDGTVVCYDWTLDGTGLIMDYDCGIWLLGTNGVFTQLLATDCYEEAPVLNPVDGRIAFHDLNPGDQAADGLYVAPPGANNPQLIVSTVPGASWPEWSPDGKDLSFVDDNNFGSLDTGTNLWVVAPDGSNLNRICDFDGTTNHFPHGALWSPDSSSLVGAGTLYGTNGLWIIPLNFDRTDCQGAPTLLPTTPGDAIDFAGSIIVARPPPNVPNLAVQSGTNGLIISWSTNFPTYTLEYTLNLNPPITWVPIGGPYTVFEINYQYQEAFNKLLPEKFFRLAPNIPQIFIQGGLTTVTIYWNTNLVGYTLQYSTNLAPPFAWQTIAGPYTVGGVDFNYSVAMGELAPAMFFRIVGH